MISSTKKIFVWYVVLAVLGLPFMFVFTSPWRFWHFFGLLVLGVVCWLIVALAERVNTARFGARMTLDEIMREADQVRMVQLLRYHLGWSPDKIAAELNRLGVRNHGLPWREHEVREIVRGIARVL